MSAGGIYLNLHTQHQRTQHQQVTHSSGLLKGFNSPLSLTKRQALSKVPQQQEGSSRKGFFTAGFVVAPEVLDKGRVASVG